MIQFDAPGETVQEEESEKEFVQLKRSTMPGSSRNSPARYLIL
jgi:hypothetical protein